MLCQLCETRKPRRHCPGVRGDICAPCCGTEREVSVSCPLDCEYLLESREHERPVEIDPATIPNADIRVTEEFLEKQQELTNYLTMALLNASLSTPGAVDMDIREALEAMIKTYRTRQSGLIYETRPSNPIAGALQQHLQNAVEQFQQALAQRTGMSTLRDADVLGVLVFLQRFELQVSNGRPRGRAMMSILLRQFHPGQGPAEAPSLIAP